MYDQQPVGQMPAKAPSTPSHRATSATSIAKKPLDVHFLSHLSSLSCVLFLFLTRLTARSALVLEMKGFLLTLSVLLAFTRENNGKPNVIQTPRYPSVYVGDDVSLKCAGTGEPIKWTLNGKPLSTSNSLMNLTMVTTANNGEYICERNAVKSDAHNLTVLELEPYAQLSLPPGGAVIPRGEARVLTLQVDEELDKWKCFAFRDTAGFMISIMPDGMNVGRVYADLNNAQRATFWCKKSASTHRSNVVTLMMTESMVMLEPATPVLKEQALTLRCAAWGGGKVEQATFYKNNNSIHVGNNDIFTIPSATEKDNGQYKCQAIYRFSHISQQAARKTDESDPQQIKVIDGPPAASLVTNYETELECSCAACKADCSTYQWHHTSTSKTRKRLDNTDKTLHVDEDGSYTCRADCGNGFSRFSNVHNFNGEPGGGGKVVVILIAIVVIFLGLIFIVMAVIIRRRHRNRTTGRIKDEGKKDKSGGDYEQIGLTDKGIYHTLAEASGQEKAEGGYEALKKTDDDKAVYHTLGAVEEPSEAQGQGGYEALQNVKAQVYQTLSSGSGKPEGEAEGGYEQLPQKDVTVEENPYEELKADKQKKEATQEKE
ncbi:hypothetical protein E1301_Tti017841 [Triplophysa tibetana]|uniref:Ig-like domain-containing protein n=1 Tax=Triplophysa tibetana TaxID=1572043 RepID=A0A5A9N7V6_9TELE|nr:hypothetical protein E1301_Tti017841 [Triplophysa tibetana]